ncbi:damage-inducible protein DinB [Sorangium cellulosum]|uniref:Damage-inducible protein DinB n=1 Tax=Sorangium cellulosum TaxID=56 RepID=A0A2L0F1W8_SORCE|nr:DinB family protein [Sorangium cellulosum]AUX45582.1 damage-inducible protein DinB [Sorangium cellulosum]
MKTLATFHAMAQNNAWSNHRLHRACAELTFAELTAERTSFFPSIYRTLTHILFVDWYYLDAFERGGRGLSLFADMDRFTDFAALRQAQREADRRLLAFCEQLPDDAALDGDVQIQRRDHVQVDRVGDVLLHLFVHQIHHRGQAHAMLAGTRVKPPQLDEFFMAEELPLREAELRDLGLPVR